MTSSAQQPDPWRHAELHCLTNFTFLRGASHPEELVQRAIELNYQALAITDECSVAGIVRAWQALQDAKADSANVDLKLIYGTELHWHDHCLVLLAPDKPAYAELCQLITHCRQQAEKGSYQLDPDNLFNLQHCLLLWRPGNHQFSTLAKSINQRFYNPDEQHNRLWLLAERLLDEHDPDRYQHVLELAQQHQWPVTCGNDVHLHIPQRQPLQDCLTAIRYNQTVSEASAQLYSNHERHLRSALKLKHLYPAELLSRSQAIAARCHFDLDEIAYHYPTDLVPEGEDPAVFLRQLVETGQRKRFPDGIPDKVQATIEKELALIRLKEYEHYFLTLYDIVRFARAQDILCQGRGSAANSVVCYCLGITEVNPTEVDLLFERFISEERHEPPDIDVDFESQRREEVIQYIYQRYGRERAALAATVTTYRPKSAVRDVGKALGLNLMQLEHVIANFGWRYRNKRWLDDLIDPRLGHSHQLQAFRDRVEEILGFPRHLSQHVGGFVITEGLLADLVPIENAAMPDRTVIQWDKEDLESLGLMKVDVLSLGMLSAIRRTLDTLNQRQLYQHSLTLASIPRDDPDTYAMLQKADSIGVFQVESRAQMNMLPRLKPRNYYDLVIEVSIVRPGPIHGDMVHPYLKRRNGEEAPDYPMPELEPILKRTLGIPLFQEQVIAFAMVAANFSAAEADTLRRSMASWRKKGHMHRLQARLASAMQANGFTGEYIQRIQRQLEGFGEYGFPESHAASFALLVYATAWLKCHYPAAFCCGLLNSQPMGFYSPAQLIQDAKQHGVQVLPVDVNHSGWDHQLDDKDHNRLRLGFRLVRGLNQEAAERLVQQRPDSGYHSLSQCLYAAQLSKQEREALAAANAFQTLSQNRFDAHWQVSEPLQQDLLRPDLTALMDEQRTAIRTLNTPNEVENLQQDYQTLGLTLGRHPMTLLREQGKLGNSLTALALKQARHESEVFVAGLVTCRQRPGTSAGVTFVTLEDETGTVNVVVWLATALRQLKLLTQSHILQVYGKVEKDDASGIIHLIAYRLLDLSPALTELNIDSHDFH